MPGSAYQLNRFWAYVEMVPETDCWLWAGPDASVGENPKVASGDYPVTPDTPREREGDAGRAASVYARECAKLRGELAALREAVERTAFCTSETEHIKPTVTIHFATHRLSNDEHPADALVRWHQETKSNV